MRVLPAAATPRLRERLAAAPDQHLTVVHLGPTATYLALRDADKTPWCVGVLAAGAVAVPNGLRTTLADLAGLDVDAARLVGGRLVVGDAEVVITRLVDAGAPRLTAPAAGGDAADVLAGIGLGDGLTPYGDDVACGWLATRVAAGRSVPTDEVRATARRTTLLSATLLEAALHGEVVPQFAAWLTTRGAAEQTALLAVGASSGRGLLEGARLALGHSAVAA